MIKYEISAPLFFAIMASRKEEVEDEELDSLNEKLGEKLEELGLPDYTVDGNLYCFETDDLEKAKEIKKKLQTLINERNEDCSKLQDWTKDCVQIFECKETKILVKTII